MRIFTPPHPETWQNELLLETFVSVPKPKQVIQVGSHLVALPEGVSALDWALERVNYQNPRIRAFGLGRCEKA